MEDVNPFVHRAAELLSGSGEKPHGTERMLREHQGRVPFSAQYHAAWIAWYLWETAGKGRDRPPSPRTNPDIVCAVCGDKNYLKGWCKKHYLIARKTKSASAPFLSPSPSTGRMGRPPLNKATTKFATVRISYETRHAIDAIRERSSLSLVAETLIREALGLPPLPEATVDHA